MFGPPQKSAFAYAQDKAAADAANTPIAPPETPTATNSFNDMERAASKQRNAQGRLANIFTGLGGLNTMGSPPTSLARSMLAGK